MINRKHHLAKIAGPGGAEAVFTANSKQETQKRAPKDFKKHPRNQILQKARGPLI